MTALIFGTLGSFIDIGTDGLTARSFIWGTNYTKRVNNLSDPANHDNCVHTARYTIYNPDPEIEYEEIICFEQDPIWGWVTVSFMFLPGYCGVFLVTDIIMEILNKNSSCLRVFLSHLLAIPSAIIFPLVLIFVKFVCLFNPGTEWKRLNIRVTGLEGALESSFQAILSLFIIFTRADRQPSSVQIGSLVVSLVMITKTTIADYLSSRQPMQMKEELKLSATLFPLFFTNSAFKMISIAIIAACLRYIGIALALAAFFIFGSFGLNVLGKRARCCPKRFILSQVNVDLTTLHLNLDDSAKKRQNLKTALCTPMLGNITV